MIPHQRAQYLFDLVPVDLVVSLSGNSPMEKQIEWRVSVFPTPVSGVGCHLKNLILILFILILFFLVNQYYIHNNHYTSFKGEGGGLEAKFPKWMQHSPSE